jgi:phage tail-like protein
MEVPGPLPFGDPPLGFRFGVVFFAAGVIPNPLDILFQKVSGLRATVNTLPVEEGGQNLYVHRLPGRIQYENLVLERGLVVGSPLAIEFNVAMSLFKFSPSNVLVTLLDDAAIPIAGWLFLNAYPVTWRVSDLDATTNTVVIETLELAYQRMQVLRV